jgi:hypothetical protein
MTISAGEMSDSFGERTSASEGAAHQGYVQGVVAALRQPLDETVAASMHDARRSAIERGLSPLELQNLGRQAFRQLTQESNAPWSS